MEPIPIHGGMLQCCESGGGAGAPVVLLHGFSFDHRMWDPQVPALEATRRVVRYDLRGFGRSSPPLAGRHHLDDLVELLDRLGVERTDLVGLSLGANVALAAAAYRPERVGRLVLMSSGLPGLAWPGRPPEEAAEVARTQGVEAARRFWLEHPILAPARASPAAPIVEAMVEEFPAHQWRPGPAADPLPPVSETLESVSAPTLVVTGALDVAGYREIGRVLADRLPDATLVELAGVGHVVNLEDPVTVNGHLAAFLASAGAPGRGAPAK